MLSLYSKIYEKSCLQKQRHNLNLSLFIKEDEKIHIKSREDITYSHVAMATEYHLTPQEKNRIYLPPYIIPAVYFQRINPEQREKTQWSLVFHYTQPSLKMKIKKTLQDFQKPPNVTP